MVPTLARVRCEDGHSLTPTQYNADYATETLREADDFWSRVATHESVLSKLSADPEKVRAFAGPDYSAAARAIVLCKLLRGSERSQALARERLSRLSGSSKEELAAWLSRASSWLVAE